MGSHRELRQQIIQALHNSGAGGHSGRQATIKRIEQFFYWTSLKSDVITTVSECLVCQQNKGEHVPTPSLLQPLPVPFKPWVDISMDFVEGLPQSNHKDTILVVIDRFSKYAHFVSLTHPFSAKDIALVFFENIHKLHGMPSTIVSDRYPIFLSQFWTQLFKKLGT